MLAEGGRGAPVKQPADIGVMKRLNDATSSNFFADYLRRWKAKLGKGVLDNANGNFTGLLDVNCEVYDIRMVSVEVRGGSFSATSDLSSSEGYLYADVGNSDIRQRNGDQDSEVLMNTNGNVDK